MPLNKRYVTKLTADGEEPFWHHCQASSDQAAAEFTAQVWFLGFPERKRAKNIKVDPNAMPCPDPYCRLCRDEDGEVREQVVPL